MELWQSRNGQVCCPKHLGNYGCAALKAQPDAAFLDTPLDRWVRMTFVEVDEWRAFLAEHDETELCETCRGGF